MLTPQDGGEMMTANMSFSDLKMRLKDLYHSLHLYFSQNPYGETEVCEDIPCADTEEPTFEFLD